jgi:class 3 adenylate cyclase
VSWSRTLRIRQSIRAQLEAGEEIALLFSDIRGFSTYTAKRGDQAAYQLSRSHEDILRERIDEFGILVKSLGDGVMAAFETPDDAILAAVAIQQAIREHNRQAPEQPIDVGIGVASGRPVMTDIDFIGNAVNLAQRLSSLAKGGQILVTGRVRELARLGDDLYSIPLGTRVLKGIGQEVVEEIAWIQEVARVSDGADRATLILTQRGTVVVELAKDSKQLVREAIGELRAAEAEEEGALSALLQRGIAWFTQRLIGASIAAFGVAREHEVDEVRLRFRRRQLVVETSDGELVLEDVDRASAEAFIAAVKSMNSNEKP